MPPLKELEPFMFRPLIMVYQTLENATYFSLKIPDSNLKENIEKDYLEKFGKNMDFSAECFNRNLEVIITNTINKDFLNPEYLKKLEELGKRIELNKLNRELVQWFNNCFSKYKLKFEIKDCDFNASEARKDIRNKYSTEFRNLQRERDLNKRTLKI